jgi:hypothetical protein
MLSGTFTFLRDLLTRSFSPQNEEKTSADKNVMGEI